MFADPTNTHCTRICVNKRMFVCNMPAANGIFFLFVVIGRLPLMKPCLSLTDYYFCLLIFEDANWKENIKIFKKIFWLINKDNLFSGTCYL